MNSLLPDDTSPVSKSLPQRISSLLTQNFLIRRPGFGIEADEQHPFQSVIIRQRLSRFPYSDEGRLLFGETIDTGADGRKGHSPQIIFPGEFKALLVTTGQQILLP